MYGLKKRSKQDESGLIQGAGTGTSDDIKKTVPGGSYIMPKDSTDAIGEENLARLGQPTDVNLSNGEYQLPPDQVHAVGVQALDEMKGQTHAPVNQPQLGIKSGQTQPELFFANGGVVPNEDTLLGLSKTAFTGNALQQPKPQATVSSQQNKSSPQQNSSFGAIAKNMLAPEHDDGSWNPVGGAVNTATGLGKSALGTAGGLVGGVAEGARSLGSWAASADNSNRGNLVAPSFDFAGDGLKQARLGLRQAFGLTPNKEESASLASSIPKSIPVTSSPPSVVNTDVKPTVNTATQVQPKADMFTLNQGQATQQLQDGNPYKIQQKGNSFSYADAGAAAQARNNGVPELQNSSGVGGIRRTNDPKGVANFMANTREMGASQEQNDRAIQQSMNSGQGFGIQYPSRPTRTDEQEAERKNVLQQISAPIQGARGMTTNQRAQLLEMQNGEDNRATTMYNTDANNATSQSNNTANNAASIAQTGMREQGSNDRAVLSENGQNTRYGLGLQQDREKFNREMSLTETKEGFGVRNAARVEKLNEMYDKAETDEQRQSIQQRINRLTGAKDQSGKDRYMAVGGGQQWDDKAGGTLTQPQRLFDTQTQQFLDTSHQTQQQNIPQVGTVINGYKFKGGDFNNPDSWEKA